MGLDKDTVIAFLSTFKHGDITDEKFRKRVIQTLVNRVYIYDDKIVLYFNVTSGNNEELSIDVQKDIEETAQNSLDGGFSVRIFNNLVEYSIQNTNTTTIIYIFHKRVFGLIFKKYTYNYMNQSTTYYIKLSSEKNSV